MSDLPLQYNALLIGRAVLTGIRTRRRILIVIGIVSGLWCIARHHKGTRCLSEVHLHLLLIEIRISSLIERLIVDLYNMNVIFLVYRMNSTIFADLQAVEVVLLVWRCLYQM
jgi:hypothetical protein